MLLSKNKIIYICVSIFLFACIFFVKQVNAQNTDDDVLEMEAIEVEAPLDPPVIIDPTQTKTSFNLEEIESRQAGNIFEIIDDIPGVSISGGPRTNGIDVNIRGFGNNEDVIIKLDGAIKNFEKYRFGGTFIEPELLKRIDVTRGAATTAIGSGALGGVIEMETKDASDFLKPGQIFGVNTKAGHRFNNDEQVTSVTMFAAPTSKLDLLVNFTNREANNYELTGSNETQNNSNLGLSDTVPSSGLAKLEYYLNDDTTLGLSFHRFRTNGLEPFDARTSSVLGGFGTVDRTSDDKTYTAKFLYNPINDLIDFKLNIGYTDTKVSEVDQGDGVGGLSALGDIEEFEYDIWSLEAKNISLVELGSITQTITFGFDGEYSDRESSEIDISESLLAMGAAEQPSGIYQQYGVFLVNEIQFGNLTLTPSIRWDYNHARVTFDEGPNNTVDLLNSFGQDNSESFDIFLPSFSASYQLGSSPFTIFYNYWEQYRPPKIDEYFTEGPFGRCFLGDLGEPYESSEVCGDLYEPETSRNNDVGLLIQKDHIWGNDKLLAKFTYFDTKVRHLVEFLNNDPENLTDQTAKEERDGFEVEVNYARKNFSVNLGYSEIDGEIEGYWINEESQFPAIGGLLDPTQQTRPVYTIPGDTLTLTTKFAIPKYNLELGWRGQHVDRRLGLNTDISAVGVPDRFDSYFVQDIWANWRPFKDTRLENSVLRFGIDNVGNKRYRVNTGGDGGSGLGNFGISRNVKVTFTLDF